MISLYFFLGLIVGSFVNVVIFRLPRGEGFVYGRSRCLSCNATLRWYDLIPLLSYILLLGKCRYCKKPFSAQYPLIELLSGLIFLFFWNEPFYILISELLIIIALIDYYYLWIPDSVQILLGVSGLFYFLYKHEFSYLYILSSLLYATFFFALWYFSKGKWIGFGDVKLVGVLGLVFGFPDSLIVIYIAVIVGGILGVFLLLFKKASLGTKVPLGTFLAAAGVFFLFFEEQINEIISRIYFG